MRRLVLLLLIIIASLPLAAQDSMQEGFAPVLNQLGFLVAGQNGEQLEWVITVTNSGDTPGMNVVISDTLRDSLRVEQVDAPRGTVRIDGQTVSVALDRLNPDESFQFSVFTTVLEGGQVDNTACLRASNFAGETCVSAMAIRSLPATGESPWWRIMIVLGGIASIVLVFVGVGGLMLLDTALPEPETP